VNNISNLFDNLQEGNPWFFLFGTEAYMESKGIQLTTENQIDALIEFQKTFEFDITFPRMDLDEYIEIISNVEDKKTQILKSKDWSQFKPNEILKPISLKEITQSTTYKVLKNLKENSNANFNYLGGYIPAPYTLVSLILNLQTASELVIYEPEFLKSLVEFSVPIIKKYSKFMSKLVDTLFILAPSECTIMKNSYIDIVQDSMNTIIKYCVSELNRPTFIHFCASKVSQVVNEDIVKPMKDAGLIGLNIPNIIETKNLARELDLILCGGIDPVNIQVQPKEIVLTELKNLIQETNDIKHIFATNCQIKWAPGQISSDKLIKLFKKIKYLLNE